MKKKVLKKREINLFNIIEEEIKQNSIRQGFSKNLIKYTKKIIKKKTDEHKDFTDIPFVTIDGEDSKDFDDAVWANYEKEKTKIMVAISDVSHFVSENDPLDLEAKKRGNSFYFPDRVIPMFPSEISNDICSLVPKKKRKCIVIEVNFLNDNFKDFKIHRAIIRSVARLTYKEVEEIYTTKSVRNKNFNLISNLYETYFMLKKKSEERGKILFSSEEYKIILTSNEDFELKKKVSYQSYKLIEEFMVLANSVIGNFLKENKITSLFRNHEKPSKEKIFNLKKIINENNIDFSSNFQNQKDFNDLLKKVKKKKNLFFFNEILLKSQSKAYYNEKNKGHFGLSINDYVHFTSPIRRYSDLIVHRNLISAYFSNQKKKNFMISDHLNLQEKKADYMERRIMERACSVYLRKKTRYEFYGFIDAVESFGIFIKAIDYPFSGLARLKRFNFKSDTKSKDNVFKVGQMVKFKIKRNNIYNGKILLEKIRLVEKNEKF
jgi:ribonuclease R